MFLLYCDLCGDSIVSVVIVHILFFCGYCICGVCCDTCCVLSGIGWGGNCCGIC